jgi:hypothetical protein
MGPKIMQTLSNNTKPSFALLIAQKMKDAGKNAGGSDADPSEGDDTGEGDTSDAVAQKATAAFFQAGQAGDFAKAYDALKDLVEMCGMSDEGSEPQPSDDEGEEGSPAQ